MNFDYILEKIKKATFFNKPFEHIYIENFLSDEHFQIVTNCSEIKLPAAANTKELISILTQFGYSIQPFPGCTTSVDEYIKCFESNSWPVDKNRLEGFGIAFRLKRCSSKKIISLINFFDFEIIFNNFRK